MSSCLGKKEHCSRKEEGEYHQNSNSVEGGVRVGAERCEPRHGNHRQHEQDKYDACDNEASHAINPRPAIIVNVVVVGLDTQLGGKEEPLQYVIIPDN